MTKAKLLPLIFSCSCLSYVSGANAFEIEHGSHIHGEARLNIVIEGQTLSAELESPVYNFTGFEREAQTDKERRAIKQAKLQIEDAALLFKLPDSAECKVADVDVEFGGHEADHKTHHHDDHEADEENAQGNEEEHQEHEEGHQEHEEGHQDLHANYQFLCGNPDALNRINFAFFELFPELTGLEVNLLTEQGALVKNLTKQSSEISF
ncbi:MAG: ZrgA family zinc uptake protein [Neptuniibacter sp.]